jgi:hypothetical protein
VQKASTQDQNWESVTNSRMKGLIFKRLQREKAKNKKKETNYAEKGYASFD